MFTVNRWREWRKSHLLALPLAALIGFLAAGPAAAHTKLDESIPDSGQKLIVAPEKVSLTFTESVIKLGAAVEVENPGGVAAVGLPKVKGRTVTWPFIGEMSNGRYTVRWRVSAQDGHPMSGKFTFVLDAPEPTGAPSSTVVTPASTPHTAMPGMTGPMEGMEGMAGMDQAAPGAEPAGSSVRTVVAIAGLVLLIVMVVVAIVIERRRHPRPAATPSASPTD